MSDWVRLRGGEGIVTLECKRCGTSATLNLPINVTTLAAFGDAFTKEHRKCKEGR